MKTKPRSTDAQGRRGLLKGAAGLPVAAAVVAALPAAATRDAPTAPLRDDEPAARGYHLSDHIRHYYRLARF
jgi:hypothetical protein